MSDRVEDAVRELNAALAERLPKPCGCRSAGHEACGGRWFEPAHPEEDGLVNKFVVLKATGEPVSPEARYFVLRYDKADGWGKAARKALAVFAEEVRPLGFDELADDLLRAVGGEAARRVVEG